MYMNVELMKALRNDSTERFFVGKKTNEFIEEQPLGMLSLPTGRIVANDSLSMFETEPFAENVSPGKYPVKLYIHHIGKDRRVSFSEIRFSAKTPVRFAPALLAEQDADTLGEKEYFGYGVDSGIGGFMDELTCLKVHKLIDTSSAQLNEALEEALENNYVHTYTTANITLPKESCNMVLFSSGFGDGVYPSFWGYDESDTICCLITDFLTSDASNPSMEPPQKIEHAPIDLLASMRAPQEEPAQEDTDTEETEEYLDTIDFDIFPQPDAEETDVEDALEETEEIFEEEELEEDEALIETEPDSSDKVLLLPVLEPFETKIPLVTNSKAVIDIPLGESVPVAPLEEILQADEALFMPDDFWKTIEDARTQAGGKTSEMIMPLKRQLMELTTTNLLRWRKMLDVYLHLSEKSTLWLAAWILCDGCDDEAFLQFRCWLIAQGKQQYLAILKNPDLLADIIPCAQNFSIYENILHIPSVIYFDTTCQGRRDFDQFNEALDACVLGKLVTVPMSDEIVYASNIDTGWTAEDSDYFKLLLPNLCNLTADPDFFIEEDWNDDAYEEESDDDILEEDTEDEAEELEDPVEYETDENEEFIPAEQAMIEPELAEDVIEYVVFAADASLPTIIELLRETFAQRYGFFEKPMFDTIATQPYTNLEAGHVALAKAVLQFGYVLYNILTQSNEYHLILISKDEFSQAHKDMQKSQLYGYRLIEEEQALQHPSVYLANGYLAAYEEYMQQIDLAKEALETKQYEAAKAAYLCMARLMPTKGEGFYHMALLYGSLGDTKMQLHYLERAAQRYQNDPEYDKSLRIWYMIGTQRIAIDDYSEAYSALRESLVRDDNYLICDTLLSLALCCSQLMRNEECEVYATAALGAYYNLDTNIDKESFTIGKPYLLMGLSQFRQNRDNATLQNYCFALENGANSASLFVTIAELLAEKDAALSQTFYTLSENPEASEEDITTAVAELRIIADTLKPETTRYNRFISWMDARLSGTLPPAAIAGAVMINETNGLYNIEFFAATLFEEAENWAQTASFRRAKDVCTFDFLPKQDRYAFALEIESYVLLYLFCGKHAETLRSLNGIGVGYLNHPARVIWKNK